MYTRTTNDRQAEAAIRAALGPDALLLWCGRPRQGLVIRRADVMFIPFSLIWGGVCLLMAWIAFENRMHPAMLTAIGLLAAAGLYAIFFRYPVDILMRKNTFYGLTETEAVIVSGIFLKKTVRIRLDTPDTITSMEHEDESGTVVFGGVDLAHNPDISGIPAAIKGIRHPKFEMILEFELVLRIIMEKRTALQDHIQPHV